MLESFSILSPLLGGALIGLAASALLLLEGRVAGISGIVGGLLSPKAGDLSWRVTFMLGLLSAGLVAGAAAPGPVRGICPTRWVCRYCWWQSRKVRA